MATHLRPPNADLLRWLKYQALTANWRVRGCSNGAGSGRFGRVKGGTPFINASDQGLPAAPNRSAIGQELRKLLPGKCSEMGACLGAGPGSLREMHLMRVVSLESLLQMLHLRSVPPCFIPTRCCMAGGQSGHIITSAKKLQPGQGWDMSITSPCRHQCMFNLGASQPQY